MNKNSEKKPLYLIVMLIMAVFSVFLLGGLAARYLTHSNASGGARTAKWGAEALFSEPESKYLKSTIATVSVYEKTGDYQVSYTNSTETAIRAKLSVEGMPKGMTAHVIDVQNSDSEKKTQSALDGSAVVFENDGKGWDVSIGGDLILNVYFTADESVKADKYGIDFSLRIDQID